MANPNSPTSKSPSTNASLHLNVPSSSTTAFTPSSPTNFTNIHHFLPSKLTSTNYLIWRSQFLPLLNGYDLMQFVDGSSSPPPRNLSSAPADTPVLNPDFLAWYKQDQILLSWILSSLTESVYAQVVGLTTSHAVWSTLAATFVSPSQARVMQLRLDLHNVSKGADSMVVYLQKVKSISNALALASTPVSDEDLIIYILGGLGDEYRAFVTSISTRGTSITLVDLHGLLLTEEIRAQSALMHLSNASAHTTTKTSNPDSRQNRDHGRGSSARRGRGRSNSHFPAPYSSYLPPHLLCQICNQPRHSALNYPQRFCPAEPTRANAAFTDTYPPYPQEWCPDTGATNYIAPDLSSLSLQSEYTSTDLVRAGNGQGSILAAYPTARTN